jgi:phosphatidylinositol alpha-1,6-mannosyltransferase
MPNREINGDTEGFGMVFIEAAACGKPSIAGNSGGTSSAVRHQMTGLLVDGTNLDEVTQSLKRLLENRELANQLGETGYRRVQADFSWARVAFMTSKMLCENIND